ncbi:hypothetical protein KSP40_PGU020038 [Platanthera guangdongensis]|uniref:Protein FAR1-RELATED SEQUENCE n=1 Tax=Platanthera guangdongensis TaxID=2320717 RepID=A0ABR2MWQ5_9ASPA
MLLDDVKFHVTEFEAEHNHELVGKNQETQIESSVGFGAAVKAGKRNSSRHLTNKPIFRNFMASTCDNENWVPKIDIEFEDDEEAYEFF